MEEEAISAGSREEQKQEGVRTRFSTQDHVSSEDLPQFHYLPLVYSNFESISRL
jgi:hypothetical protein